MHASKNFELPSNPKNVGQIRDETQELVDMLASASLTAAHEAICRYLHERRVVLEDILQSVENRLLIVPTSLKTQTQKAISTRLQAVEHARELALPLLKQLNAASRRRS